MGNGYERGWESWRREGREGEEREGGTERDEDGGRVQERGRERNEKRVREEGRGKRVRGRENFTAVLARFAHTLNSVGRKGGDESAKEREGARGEREREERGRDRDREGGRERVEGE